VSIDRIFLARHDDRDGRQQNDSGADCEGQDALGTDDGKNQRTGGKAQRQNRGVDAQHQAAPGGRRGGVDPEFGEDEQDRDRAVENDAQRKPHPQCFGEIESPERTGRGRDNRQHHRGDHG
jgi:hypothetical protein